ncbi:SigE family RNA polymerase sigma factor [Kineococcus rubinsiae]|uniref:SigE family RNA polymerase sigma factor n=1 Tax=Kineococcus rubinsiae TaxID=2609562 RepID=UPI00142FEFD1|nr:SigE family RNA polymerase sigma factor [Kineococcus rubinsiae]NIZ90310.1 SigE family RNA polymerase sigma factor [Kineococcus rubinsiae]
MGLLGRRDEEFTTFVAQHGDALLRAAHFLTGDPWAAEDLVQLALTKTYLAWPAAQGKVSYAYARQALLSAHTDTWRRRRWREDTTAPEDLPAHPPAGAAAGAPTWADPAHTVADHDAVDQALRRLTPRERAVIVLRYLEDLTEKDTAALLNVSIGTVKALHSRALAKLRADPASAQMSDEPPSPLGAAVAAHSPVGKSAEPLGSAELTTGRGLGISRFVSRATRKDSSCVDQ